MHWFIPLLLSGPIWNVCRLIKYKIKSFKTFQCVLSKTTRFEVIYWDQSLSLLQDPKNTFQITLFRPVTLLALSPVCDKFVHVKVFCQLLSHFSYHSVFNCYFWETWKGLSLVPIFCEIIVGFYFVVFKGLFSRRAPFECQLNYKRYLPSWNVISRMYVATTKRHEVELCFRKLRSIILAMWLLADLETGRGINTSCFRDGC